MRICVFRIMKNQLVCDRNCPKNPEECLNYTPRDCRINEKGLVEWDITK